METVKQTQPSKPSETLDVFAKRLLTRLQSNWPEHPITEQIAKDLIHEIRDLTVKFDRDSAEKMVSVIIRDGAISDDKWNGFPRVRQMWDTTEVIWKKRPAARGWVNPLADKTPEQLSEMRDNFNEFAANVERLIMERRMSSSESKG